MRFKFFSGTQAVMEQMWCRPGDCSSLGPAEANDRLLLSLPSRGSLSKSSYGLGSIMSFLIRTGQSPTAKCFIVHSELKIMPLVTQNHWHCMQMQIRKRSTEITDNLVKILWCHIIATCRDTKTPQDRHLCIGHSLRSWSTRLPH